MGGWEGGVRGGGLEGRGSIGWKRQKRESGRSGELEEERGKSEGERPGERKRMEMKNRIRED